MKRSSCASGSGYVPSCSIGFCVASTRNGSGSGIRRVADRDLALLHHLEQRRLDLRRSAVDLIGQQEVAEDRAELGVECALAGPVDARADEVGRHQIGGELDPRERSAEHACAVVLIVRVFARPGTPSIRRWPWASRQTSTRSSIPSWPAITRRISKSACSSRSLASAGEGTDRSLGCSVTSSPSVAYTESYTRAGELKFLLRG